MNNLPKRILIIGLTERMGGVETFIYNTTIHSDKTKYVYDYLVHGANGCVFEDEINKFYNDNEQHIFFVRSFKKEPFACYKDLKKFYAENGKKYDFIHLETGSTAEIVYTYPFYKKYNIKVITHSHNGFGYSPFINKVFRVLVNKVTSKRLSCSNEATKWLFGDRYIDSTRTILNGIDTNRFKFNLDARQKIRSQYHIGDELIVGHIGRFSEQKNHKFILKIFKALLEKHPNSKLMLVGVGELQDSIVELSREMGLDQFIIFVGRQYNTEDYYSAFDVFLMPSLYEGLPIVGVEAQCEGLPCLFSNKIDKQILITDKAIMLDLEEAPEVWAELILDAAKNGIRDREKYAAEIEKSGYSLTTTIKTLEEVYEVE